MAAAVLIFAGMVAYHNSFTGPFVFDDTWSIPLNPSIRQFGTALSPPNDNGQTVSGRPLLNLSFAVNYAISGRDVWSYHAGNLLIHIAAGLVLFGLVRRALLLPALRGRFGRDALSVSLAAAALWLVHPLQTESVTYIAQRAESLMALWYLLTLYCFVRGAGERKTAWLAMSVVACLLGMATKEVMVSAPLMVLLCDRALVAGSFRETWARRKTYYAFLAATLLLLLWLVITTGNRGNTAGFGLVKSAVAADATTWTYLLTQAKAITTYIGLAFWPRGQVFDYGTAIVTNAGAVWLQGLCVLALAGGALWLSVRRPAAGLAAFFFFAVLAPTSSFVPVATEPVAEHRMYLPLVSLALAAALGSHWLIGRKNKPTWVAAVCVVVCLLAVLTVRRNRVYGDDLLLWRDTVEKVPGSARANNNYANALARNPDTCGEALRYCQRAIDLNPEFALSYNNYGYALGRLKRFDEALPYYDKALGLRQGDMEIMLSNRGFALYSLGRLAEAESDYKASLQIRPDYEEALNNYGNVLQSLGRPDEALVHIDRALEVDPRFAAAWNNRGNVFSARGLDRDEALRCYKLAAALDPMLWEAQDNVGRYCMLLGRHGEAVPYFRAALGARPPDEATARNRLANALMLADRQAESIPEFERVIALKPDFYGAYHNLAVALSNIGRAEESLPHFRTALRLGGAQAPVHGDHAAALAKLGRYDEAIAEAQAALRIDPGYALAREQVFAYTSEREREREREHERK
jgi:tetratricopeptide (TPR) repeat protein